MIGLGCRCRSRGNGGHHAVLHTNASAGKFETKERCLPLQERALLELAEKLTAAEAVEHGLQ